MLSKILRSAVCLFIKNSYEITSEAVHLRLEGSNDSKVERQQTGQAVTTQELVYACMCVCVCLCMYMCVHECGG